MSSQTKKTEYTRSVSRHGYRFGSICGYAINNIQSNEHTCNVNPKFNSYFAIYHSKLN